MRREPRLFEVYQINRIVAAVAEETGVHRREILSHRRNAKAVEARDRVSYEANKLLGIPLIAIAGYLDRDHTSVMSAVGRQEKRLGAMQ